MQRTDLNVGPGAQDDYDEWAKRARHGDVLVYWVGDLQADRQIIVSEDDLDQTTLRKQIGALNAVAKRVAADIKAGDILVTQKRLGPSNYEYRAHRIRQDQAPAVESKRVRTRNADLVFG